MSTSPLVSFVMPVHNARPFLDESIGSVLNQTFADFEFVILDDASNDGSTEALREWARRDARIRLYESARNLGPAGSSNFVVEQARARLVARMDADDVSYPERLRRQWEVLERHPEVALVGTLYEGIDERGRRVRPRDRWRLSRGTIQPPFPHGSVLFRREVFEAVGGYRGECDGWEDQDLFLRMRRRARVVTINEPLYLYRFRSNSTTVCAGAKAVGLRRRCLAEALRGRDYTRLLEGAGCNDDDVDPAALADALYLRGSMLLWAGHTPRVLGEAWRHKSFGSGTRALRTLVWASWAEVSPASLRLFLRTIIRARDLLAGRRVRNGEVYEWRLK